MESGAEAGQSVSVAAGGVISMPSPTARAVSDAPLLRPHQEQGEVDFACSRGYLRPTLHGDRGKARVLMKAINADKARASRSKREDAIVP